MTIKAPKHLNKFYIIISETDGVLQGAISPKKHTSYSEAVLEATRLSKKYEEEHNKERKIFNVMECVRSIGPISTSSIDFSKIEYFRFGLNEPWLVLSEGVNLLFAGKRLYAVKYLDGTVQEVFDDR